MLSVKVRKYFQDFKNTLPEVTIVNKILRKTTLIRINQIFINLYKYLLQCMNP